MRCSFCGGLVYSVSDDVPDRCRLTLCVRSHDRRAFALQLARRALAKLQIILRLASILSQSRSHRVPQLPDITVVPKAHCRCTFCGGVCAAFGEIQRCSLHFCLRSVERRSFMKQRARHALAKLLVIIRLARIMRKQKNRHNEVIARMHERGLCVADISEVLGTAVSDVVAALMTDHATPTANSKPMPTLRQRLSHDPQQFLCPVLYDLMRDPVVAEDGHTYERDAILQVLQNSGKSPITNVPLGQQVIPNQVLKSQIIEHRDKVFKEILQLSPYMPKEDVVFLFDRADHLVRPHLPSHDARRKMIELLRCKLRLLPETRSIVTSDLLRVALDGGGIVSPDLLTELPIEPDLLRDLPTSSLCSLAESLAKATRSSDAALVLAVAGDLEFQAGQIVAAAQRYVQAFSLDRSNVAAADGLVAICPNVLDGIMALGPGVVLSLNRNGLPTPSNRGLLKTSLRGTPQMTLTPEIPGPLRPVEEFHESAEKVTCINFGQERLRKAYVLLATGYENGLAIIYRCYRTDMEIAMLVNVDFPRSEEDSSDTVVHSRLVGHTGAITSIFFDPLEDQLITTSMDKSVRFWHVDSGDVLKVFTDASPVHAAAFLPLNPQKFVSANSKAILSLVNVTNGLVLHKVKVETEVWALSFDETNLFLFAGTKSGSIYVLEVSDSSKLKFKFKTQVSQGGVTCITFVPGSYQRPSRLLANTSDNSIVFLDCTYSPVAARPMLISLIVRHRAASKSLKSCYSPSGDGYLVFASQDKDVYTCSLASHYRMKRLTYHQVPVVTVAINSQDTVLASADSLGHIVLWRRIDFVQLIDV